MSDADFAWLAEHNIEHFDQYRGKWIAVADEEIVGVGDTAPEAAEIARSKVPDGDFILQAIDNEVDVIYGSA